MFQTIMGAIAANTLALGILAFLTRSIITHYLNKDVAEHKIKLEFDTKNEIEKFKADLEKEKVRLQISYGGIFEKQANAIIEIHKLLVALERNFEWVIHNTTNKEFFGAFIDSYKELFNYYELNRILLPENIEDNFEQLRNDMYSAVARNKTIETQLNRSHLLNDDDFEKLFDRQDKVYKIIDQLPGIKKELRSKLRNLIGTNHIK